MSMQISVERLNEFHRYLLYFPEEKPKQLDQDEIIEIYTFYKFNKSIVLYDLSDAFKLLINEKII